MIDCTILGLSLKDRHSYRINWIHMVCLLVKGCSLNFRLHNSCYQNGIGHESQGETRMNAPTALPAFMKPGSLRFMPHCSTGRCARRKSPSIPI